MPGKYRQRACEVSDQSAFIHASKTKSLLRVVLPQEAPHCTSAQSSKLFERLQRPLYHAPAPLKPSLPPMFECLLLLLEDLYKNCARGGGGGSCPCTLRTANIRKNANWLVNDEREPRGPEKIQIKSARGARDIAMSNAGTGKRGHAVVQESGGAPEAEPQK